jgi:hypothetical protein
MFKVDVFIIMIWTILLLYIMGYGFIYIINKNAKETMNVLLNMYKPLHSMICGTTIMFDKHFCENPA